MSANRRTRLARSRKDRRRAGQELLSVASMLERTQWLADDAWFDEMRAAFSAYMSSHTHFQGVPLASPPTIIKFGVTT